MQDFELWKLTLNCEMLLQVHYHNQEPLKKNKSQKNHAELQAGLAPSLTRMQGRYGTLALTASTCACMIIVSMIIISMIIIGMIIIGMMIISMIIIGMIIVSLPWRTCLKGACPNAHQSCLCPA